MANEQPKAEGKSLRQILADRRAKLDAWRADGVSGFANDFAVEHTTADVRGAHGDASADELEALAPAPRYTLGGRVMMLRVIGKLAFAVLRDRHGDLQIAFDRGRLGDAFAHVKRLDTGDIIGVAGTPFRTKSGELTLNAHTVRLLTKNLRPPPEKFHGLTDVEARYRRRYEDLAVHLDVREVFRRRARIVQTIRNFLTERGYLEVETPILHPLVGGAAARPFVTHHNTLDCELYLRIAPELYLKRLLVGGFDRVFEINRNFRNEGIDTTHNPEFTMLEFYEAYAGYEHLMTTTEQLLGRVAVEACGTTVVSYGDGMLDFTPPYRRLTVRDAVLTYGADAGVTAEVLDDSIAMRNALDELGATIKGHPGPGGLLVELFETLAQAKLWNPTFITAFPTEVSPLARRNDHDPAVTDRFELYCAGFEVANAFSELNDPIDQHGRFLAQLEAKRAGDTEAADYDADYIRALEIGMPPAAGEGIGIDRLTMLLTNSASIRDVILFPLLKPEPRRAAAERAGDATAVDGDDEPLY